ncbi:MAG TPA: DUF4199 domain-containing protein [Chryseolinea sp.]|nr:DUF4199 domain-containing protein [Chryseolinea sp.]
MEENSTSLAVTPRSVGIRYGLIMGIISIVLFLVFVIVDMETYLKIGRWVNTAMAIAILILAHLYYRKNGDGFMNYGQGIGIAFWSGLISSVVGSVFTYIYIKFVDQSMITAIREGAIRDMEEKGQSDEQIDMAMKFVDMFTNAEALLLFGLFFGVLGMIVIGLIVTIFTQKPRPETFV